MPSSASTADKVIVTANQYELISWLWLKCDSHRKVKTSYAKIAKRFSWSKTYAFYVVGRLEQKRLLKVLPSGEGRSESWFRLARVSPVDLQVRRPSSVSSSPKTTNGKPKTTNGKVRVLEPSKEKKHVQEKPQEGPIQKTFSPLGTILFGIGNANASARNESTRKASTFSFSLFEGVEAVKKQVKIRSTPFQRFRQRWDDPSVWKGPDFVCYYSYLYKARYGEMPALDWPRECGAARVLLGRLRKPDVLKAFLQVAIYRCQYRPRSISSFTQADFFDSCLEQAREGYATEDEIESDYGDDAVFPWLQQTHKEATHKFNQDHQKFLARAAGLI